MKKRIFLFIICAMFLLSTPVYAAEPGQIPGNGSDSGTDASGTAFVPADAPEITAKSAILMDLDTGDILYEKDPHRKSEPASTTKLMTALLAVDHLKFSDQVVVKDGALDGIDYDAVTIGLSPGEAISVEDLFYAMLLPSANDAANVLAMASSKTVGSFVKEMNATAESLGCKNTHFANANGLPDSNHYTTAYDMALIAQAAYGRSRIRDIIREQVHWIPPTNMVGQRELWTTNQLLYDVTDYYYEPCTGGKTGYTESAGNTMVAFAEKDGRRLVSVCFGCPEKSDRYTDSSTLLEFGFTAYHKISPLLDYKLSEANETDNPILENYYARLGHSLPEFTLDTSIILYTRTSVTAEDIGKELTYKPDRSGQEVGSVALTYKGETLATVPIVSDRTHMTEDLSALSLSQRRYAQITTTPAPTRSEIFRDVVKESLPRMILCLVAAISLCLITILVAQHRKKNRTAVRRYFGDGPVPARDGPEVMAEIERRKAENRYLSTVEDETELPKINLPDIKMPSIKTADGATGADDENVSIDDIQDELPTRTAKQKDEVSQKEEPVKKETAKKETAKKETAKKETARKKAETRRKKKEDLEDITDEG